MPSPSSQKSEIRPSSLPSKKMRTIMKVRSSMTWYLGTLTGTSANNASSNKTSLLVTTKVPSMLPLSAEGQPKPWLLPIQLTRTSSQRPSRPSSLKQPITSSPTSLRASLIAIPSNLSTNTIWNNGKNVLLWFIQWVQMINVRSSWRI